MNKSKLTLISLILAIAVTAPWVIRRHYFGVLRANEDSLSQQGSLLAWLSAENGRLSDLLAKSKSSESLSAAELQELLRLRNEVAQLHGTIQKMDQIRSNIVRLREHLKDAAAEKENGRENDSALLADESGLRQGRVARLRRWLEGMPQEKIPELQFIYEEEWMDKVDSPLITDTDFREAIGLLRGEAESRFIPMAFQALKQYAAANNGQFPSDVLQLTPYFSTPISETILQRYEIVPANTLIPDLAQTGGDWLITQKAPVNKSFDQRLAIGLTHWRKRGGGSQWDPLP